MTSVVPAPPVTQSVTQWAKVIDHSRCIGCHACSTACKSENEVPLGVHRTYVKYVDVGTFPQARRAFQVTRCNQCEAPPCATACPTSAMYRRPDGIVDFDKSVCIGCKACIAACPYDAIFINPGDNAAEKCNFCAHRLDVGLEPACVVVCPTEAILIGDLKNGRTRIAEIVHRQPVQVRRPEKETRPKLYYVGAHQATLDPLAARRPEGGLYMWSEQGEGVAAGHPGTANSAAQAIVAYDVPHGRPWGFKVSLYTWTKSIAAGAYLVAALFALIGWLEPRGALFRWVAPLISVLFLAATGGLLIWDLKRPQLFWLILKRPQWRSWLVRGTVVILAYAALLVVHLLCSVLGWTAAQVALAWAGVPIAALAAAYTAFLFAQCKARDLWQSPLLPPHLLLQAVLAGTAVLLPFTTNIEAGEFDPMRIHEDVWLRFALPFAVILHLLFVAGEATLTHGTAHARLAVHQMIRGRFARFFWPSIALIAAVLFLPMSAGAAAALLGLLLYEHAYVQAGQSVPLA
jgi:Fe-S-cluster-containing dehydrogenase component/formate-dependent nitrite reductase membrane component NrfD